MLDRIYAYTVLNIKSLLKDKISFIWSITLPLVMFALNFAEIQNENDMVYWWVYILVCSYVFGIGLYVMELKEEGSIKTIFSIYNSSWALFWGNLMTQVIYSCICIFIFDCVVVILKDFSLKIIGIQSIKSIILCIPFAFAGYGMTVIKKCNVNTLKTIFSILIFVMFVLSGMNSILNKYNPLIWISNCIIGKWEENIGLYICFMLFSLFIGSVGICCFTSNSSERR